MDLYLTRLPLPGGLIIRAPSSDGLGGLPVCWPEGLVGVKLPALLMVCMFLAAVGAFLAGLTGHLGWIDDGHSRCLCRGNELLEHGHHVFHLLRVLCLKHVRNLGDYHGLSLGVQDFFFRRLVCDAFTNKSDGRPVPFDHLGVFVLNVHAEVGEGLVDQKFGVPFLHCGVKLTRGLISQNDIREAQFRLLGNVVAFQLTLIFFCSCKHRYRRFHSVPQLQHLGVEVRDFEVVQVSTSIAK